MSYMHAYNKNYLFGELGGCNQVGDRDRTAGAAHKSPTVIFCMHASTAQTEEKKKEERFSAACAPREADNIVDDCHVTRRKTKYFRCDVSRGPSLCKRDFAFSCDNGARLEELRDKGSAMKCDNARRVANGARRIELDHIQMGESRAKVPQIANQLARRLSEQKGPSIDGEGRVLESKMSYHVKQKGAEVAHEKAEGRMQWNHLCRLSERHEMHPNTGTEDSCPDAVVENVLLSCRGKSFCFKQDLWGQETEDVFIEIRALWGNMRALTRQSD